MFVDQGLLPINNPIMPLGLRVFIVTFSHIPPLHMGVLSFLLGNSCLGGLVVVFVLSPYGIKQDEARRLLGS